MDEMHIRYLAECERHIGEVEQRLTRIDTVIAAAEPNSIVKPYAQSLREKLETSLLLAYQDRHTLLEMYYP